MYVIVSWDAPCDRLRIKVTMNDKATERGNTRETIDEFDERPDCDLYARTNELALDPCDDRNTRGMSIHTTYMTKNYTNNLD